MITEWIMEWLVAIFIFIGIIVSILGLAEYFDSERVKQRLVKKKNVQKNDVINPGIFGTGANVNAATR